jgi:3',5'-cyclic AMP phosphodiesterase CpdA
MHTSKFALSLLCAILLFYACNSTGDIGDQENPNSSKSLKGTIKPDSFKNIILTWQEDPKTSQAVTWRTDVRVKQAMAEIAPSTPSPDFGNSAQQLLATSSALETGRSVSYYHTVNFTGLRPDTLYAYRVGDANVWSEWFQFRTASENRQPFSFIYLGDAQHDIHSLWSRAIRAAVLEAPKARFIVHTGDMVDRRNSDSQWAEWFEAGGWILATIPNIPVAGNHEYKNRELGGPSLSKYWNPQFALPEIGREDLDETVYYVDFQGVRIVVLNSNLEIKDQAIWMKTLLANNPNRWTIMAFHHPIYSSVKGRNNKKLIKHWKPVIEEYDVDLVIQGHDHVYARGRGFGSKVEDGRGPIYVTSVSGPDMYRLDGRNWMDRAAENTQFFQVISISGNVLSYRSITVTGEIYDAFEIIKEEKRMLINKIPSHAAEYRFNKK